MRSASPPVLLFPSFTEKLPPPGATTGNSPTGSTPAPDMMVCLLATGPLSVKLVPGAKPVKHSQPLRVPFSKLILLGHADD